VACAALLAWTAAAAGAPELTPVAADALCVTHGAMRPAGEALRLAAAAVRAFARGSSGERAELRFRYLGRSDEVSKLASGDVRAQLGLKLRALDGCNLVYVMWRFEPKPELVVQVKRNPGARTNAECGTRGYERVKPARSARVGAPEPGSRHALGAVLDGRDLVVRADGAVVWQGTLPASADDLVGGPAGLRADNVAAELELAAEPAAASAARDARCPATASDDD
jgi:hypothetical protein